MNFPVFDLHCDTASRLVCFEKEEHPQLRENAMHIDLTRAKKLSGYAQCFACFTTSDTDVNPVDQFEKQLNFLMREMEKNYDIIRIAYTPEEIEENYANGLMSAILTIEGPAGIGYDPALLEDLEKIGFRISTLGWNEKNALTGSCVTGGGLTEQGRAYVKELQRLHMVVDVSHISDEGFWDIMNITDGPVIATHSNSRYVFDHRRNITDDMFLAVCKTGGVTGINLYPDFLGKDATIDTACDHIFHFLELDPECHHISLGGDLDGIESLPCGFNGIEDYNKLANRLLERGLTDEMVRNLFWNNAIGVLKNALHYNP